MPFSYQSWEHLSWRVPTCGEAGKRRSSWPHLSSRSETALLLIGSECSLPPVLRFLRAAVPLLSSFGRRSYEIYLFHLVVIEFMWIVSADLKFNLAVYSPLWLFAFLCVAYGVAYS